MHNIHVYVDLSQLVCLTNVLVCNPCTYLSDDDRVCDQDEQESRQSKRGSVTSARSGTSLLPPLPWQLHDDRARARYEAQTGGAFVKSVRHRAQQVAALVHHDSIARKQGGRQERGGASEADGDRDVLRRWTEMTGGGSSRGEETQRKKKSSRAPNRTSGSTAPKFDPSSLLHPWQRELEARKAQYRNANAAAAESETVTEAQSRKISHSGKVSLREKVGQVSRFDDWRKELEEENDGIVEGNVDAMRRSRSLPPLLRPNNTAVVSVPSDGTKRQLALAGTHSDAVLQVNSSLIPRTMSFQPSSLRSRLASDIGKIEEVSEEESEQESEEAGRYRSEDDGEQEEEDDGEGDDEDDVGIGWSPFLVPGVG